MSGSTAATISYTCASCEHEFDVDVTFGSPARTYGDPFYCHDAEPDECEPANCPECECAIDEAKAVQQAADWCEAGRCDDYEQQQREEEW